MSLNEAKTSEIAAELSRLLEFRYDEIFYYESLLLGADLPYSEAAERDGLIIKSDTGKPLPLHPKLALSNIYRTSVNRNPELRANRKKVDILINELASHYEKTSSKN